MRGAARGDLHWPPQAGWCRLEKGPVPSGTCPVSCFAPSRGWEKELCWGAGRGRMSQEWVCSGGPCIQPLAHPRCRHPPDPLCHPLPVPWVLCVAFGKKLSLSISHASSVSRLESGATNTRSGKRRALCSCPVCSAPRDAAALSLPSLLPGPGHQFSPLLHSRAAPSSTVDWDQLGQCRKVLVTHGGRRGRFSKAQTRLWSPSWRRWRQDFYLLQTRFQLGQGWGVRQIVHLHFNFNKIVLFCVLLQYWCNKRIY